MKAGIFISVEGSEGAGKSSNLALLRDYLLAKNLDVCCVREPGGTVLGEEIRRLLNRDDIFPPMCQESELLLFLASRAQIVREKILPALEAGSIVLCDRYFDSTVAYQSGARAISEDTVKTLNAFVAGCCVPDLTFLLDLSPEEGLRRIYGRCNTLDRLERESSEFFQKVRHSYLRIAREEPRRVHVIDAGVPLASIQQEMRRVVGERFGL
ncbi:MAG: dTMP kinase [Puniceicoccales bacterium]|nr:dTMP kinase [Puniceicoccales bacterium]